MSDTKPIIVTGCQRSGTTWAAAAITACGHWASHERFINERVIWPLKPETIESSHCAAALLPGLQQKYDAKIIHLVRNPLAVVSSIKRRQTFAQPLAPSAKWALQHGRGKVFRMESRETIRIMEYWLNWNQMVEDYADVRIRLEDASTKPSILADVLPELGRPVTLKRAELALSVIPPVNVGQQVRTGPVKLPPGKTKDRLIAKAQEYGYRI